MTTINAGDRVCYAAKFLRAICDYSAASANRQGDVKSTRATKAGVLCAVAWHDGLGTDNILATHLIKVSERHLEPA